MGSSCAKYVGSSLIAAQGARAREMVKVGLSARPALTAECASSSRPSCARAAANTKYGCGKLRLASIDRRNHTTAWSQEPSWLFAMPAKPFQAWAISIARTEAQGLADVSLCFFGATNEHLAKSDTRMGAGEISIQRQCMFTFGDAVRSALGEYLDIPQQPMAARVVWNRRQGFDQLCFGRREGRHGIGHKEICALAHVRARRSNERVDIVGIRGERAIEKAARLRKVVGGRALIEPSQSLKIEVHRVGGRGQFGTSRLSGYKMCVKRARQTCDDFVLHVEEIGERLIESLGPEMIPGFGVDQLHVDAHAVSAALNAALEDIADIQLAPDCLHIVRT